jgi:hypothetical protein
MRRFLAIPFLGAFGLLSAATAWSSEGISSTLDIESVLKKMSGCFRVTFNYIEDGEHDAFYEPVYERAEVSPGTPLSVERTLIVEGQVQKHWSEVWTPVSDTVWRQEVTGPFGDFRYACDGTWVLNQWTCTAENAPKPRRDAARPYHHLTRLNTLQINDRRWVHVQSNSKWTEDGTLYSVEAGWNVYERAQDELCQTKDHEGSPDHGL